MSDDTPHPAWRVQDISSKTELTRQGLKAQTTIRVSFDVGMYDLEVDECDEIRQHFDNYFEAQNTDPSPFIWAYDNKQSATEEARRRVRAGKEGVSVLKIKSGRWNKYFNARQLRRRIGHFGYEKSFAADHVLFMNQVPDNFILERTELN